MSNVNASFLIPSFDETALFFSKNEIEQPRAAVLFVHGLCEHSGRYATFAERLNGRGFNVYRFDHRGHGQSEGQRAYYSDFHQLTDDVNAVVEYVKQTAPGLPLYVIGHSMGGFASSAFATKYPNKVQGVVLSGALTRYNTEVAGPLPLDAPLGTYLPNGLSDAICSDPQIVRDYENDPLVGKEFTVDLFNSLGRGVEWLKQHAADFVDPVLVLHGANDLLVSEKDSRDFYGEIASADKTLKIYASLMHEIFNEPQREAIMEEVIVWIEDRLG